jgi:hypothetical protein
MADPTNSIGVRVMNSSRENIMLREGLLGCNSAALLTWTALQIYLAVCDFECHERPWLPSLDTNEFSDEMVKGPIQQHRLCFLYFL